MRVAVIGCGSIGARHARNLRTLGQEPVLFDVDRERVMALASELHTVALPLTRVDAVMLCTPAHTHAPIARQWLQADGYTGPLFVEKPIVTSVDDAEVFEAWPSPVLQVGYNWRFNREILAWQQRWPDLPSHLSFTCDTDYAKWPGRDYAEPALECSHELDLAFAILGPSLQVTHAEVRGAGASFYLRAAVTTVRVDIFWKSRVPRRTFVARYPNGLALRFEPSPASIEQSYLEELAHFLTCVTDHVRPDCTALDGVRVLDVLAAARAHV